MTEKLLIDRELLVELRDAASECLDREDRQRRQMIYSRLVSDSDAILTQSAPEPVQGEAMEVVGWRRADRPYEMTAYPSVCSTWHRHGFPVQALYTSPAKPDAELVQCLKFARVTMATVAEHANLRGVEYRSLMSEIKRIDAKLAELKP